MLALALALLLVVPPAATADMTGYYELEVPMGTIGIEVSLDGEVYRGLFYSASEDMPPLGATSVAVRDNVIDVVVAAHGMELRFHLEVDGEKVTGHYTAGEEAPVAFTGRRLAKRPPPA